MGETIKVTTNLEMIPVTTIDSRTTVIHLTLNLTTVRDLTNSKEIKAMRDSVRIPHINSKMMTNEIRVVPKGRCTRSS